MNVQLNHPGSQKPYKLGSGYRNIGNNIIREWSNDDDHFRKFIQNNGYFLNGLPDVIPTQSELYFWGEWEGNSIFMPFPKEKEDLRIFPNGLHKPFHSTAIRGKQNTDPYIYGENFTYCICKQTGKMCNLTLDDLILFGTTFPSLEKFYIDTVFVVKDFNPSLNIQSTSGVGYSQVYKEETLEQLNEYLKLPNTANNNKIYKSKTWWDDKDYFSFVPCKEKLENYGFERFFISLNDPLFQLSSYPSGKSFLKRSTLNSKELWKKIVELCVKQGFKLGVKFEEPSFNNCLQSTNEKKSDPNGPAGP